METSVEIVDQAEKKVELQKFKAIIRDHYYKTSLKNLLSTKTFPQQTCCIAYDPNDKEADIFVTQLSHKLKPCNVIFIIPTNSSSQSSFIKAMNEQKQVFLIISKYFLKWTQQVEGKPQNWTHHPWIAHLLIRLTEKKKVSIVLLSGNEAKQQIRGSVLGDPTPLDIRGYGHHEQLWEIFKHLQEHSEFYAEIIQTEKQLKKKIKKIEDLPESELTQLAGRYGDKLATELAATREETIADIELFLRQRSEKPSDSPFDFTLVEALKKKYQSKPMAFIERFYYGKTVPIAESFINLAILKQEEFKEKEKKAFGESKEFRDERLQSFETIHQIKELITLPKIFDEEKDKKLKHLLIEGRAGIGKSTLCSFIANRWAAGDEEKLGQWIHQFKAIIWIPLRQLQNVSVKTRAEFIHRICLLKTDQEQISIEQIKQELSMLEKQYRVLYLLDGYDEVSDVENNDLLQLLLEKDYWLLTSRPYCGATRTTPDRHFENVGFVEEDITRYVEKFFQDFNESEKAESLLTLIKQNPNIKGIAHIPINLELLCSVWKEYQSAVLKKTPLTMTELYQAITRLLAKRYLQERCQVNTRNMLPEEYETHPRCGEVLQFLEALAWQLMQRNTLVFAPYDFSDLIRKHVFDLKERETALEDIFKHFGLLKGTGDERVAWLYQQYYFIDLTFQEYFAANYVFKLIRQNNAKEIDFIVKNLNVPYFQMVWHFLKELAPQLFENITNINGDFKLLVLPSAFIVDEDFISEIDKQFHQSNHQIILNIYGPCGSGKSELGTYYANLATKRKTLIKYDRVIFLDAKLDLRIEFMKLTRVFNIQKANVEFDELIAEFYSSFANHSKVLLIIDNLEENIIIDNYLPPRGFENNLHILLFTEVPVSTVLTKEIALPRLSERDIAKYCGEKLTVLDPENIIKLSAFLNYFPATLHYSLSYIQSAKISIAGYIEKFLQERSKLIELSTFSANLHEQSAYIAWQLSMNKIDEEDIQYAEDVLYACAVVAPTAIPKEFIISLHQFGNEEQTNKALEALAKYGLIKITTHFIHICKLLQRLVKIRLSLQATDVYPRKTLQFWISIILGSINKSLTTPEELSQERIANLFELLPHAEEVCVNAERANFISDSLYSVLDQIGLYKTGLLADYFEAKAIHLRALQCAKMIPHIELKIIKELERHHKEAEAKINSEVLEKQTVAEQRVGLSEELNHIVINQLAADLKCYYSKPDNCQIKHLFTKQNNAYSLSEIFVNVAIINQNEQMLNERALFLTEEKNILEIQQKLHNINKPLPIRNLFLSENEKQRRLYIQGKAGIGKSIFCQYIANIWLRGVDWLRPYKVVFWLPLRRLKDSKLFPADRNYNPADILFIAYESFHAEASGNSSEAPLAIVEESLFSLVLKSCQFIFHKLVSLYFNAFNKLSVFSTGTSATLITKDRFYQVIESLNKLRSMLLLLDGYDEIESLEQSNPNLYEAFKLLLVQSNHWLLTSRPSVNTTSLPDSIKLEIIGFTDDNIKEFIDRFFAELKKNNQGFEKECDQRKEALLKVLKNNFGLFDLCHVPINLELLCNLWAHQPVNNSTLTLTEIYRDITLWLLRRCEEYKENNISQSKSIILSNQQIEEGYKDVTDYLGVAAFNAHKHSSLVISIPNNLKIRILETGLLKETTPGLVVVSNIEQKQYYFIHLTFQEYYVAKCIATAIIENKSLPDNTTPYAFVTNYKYHPWYRNVLIFTTGILYEFSQSNTPRSAKPLQNFWEMLFALPRDLFKLGETILFAQCLEECHLLPGSSYGKDLEIEIRKIVCDYLANPQNPLLQFLYSKIKNTNQLFIKVCFPLLKQQCGKHKNLMVEHLLLDKGYRNDPDLIDSLINKVLNGSGSIKQTATELLKGLVDINEDFVVESLLQAHDQCKYDEDGQEKRLILLDLLLNSKLRKKDSHKITKLKKSLLQLLSNSKLRQDACEKLIYLNAIVDRDIAEKVLISLVDNLDNKEFTKRAFNKLVLLLENSILAKQDLDKYLIERLSNADNNNRQTQFWSALALIESNNPRASMVKTNIINAVVSLILLETKNIELMDTIVQKLSYLRRNHNDYFIGIINTLKNYLEDNDITYKFAAAFILLKFDIAKEEIISLYLNNIAIIPLGDIQKIIDLLINLCCDSEKLVRFLLHKLEEGKSEFAFQSLLKLGTTQPQVTEVLLSILDNPTVSTTYQLCVANLLAKLNKEIRTLQLFYEKVLLKEGLLIRYQAACGLVDIEKHQNKQREIATVLLEMLSQPNKTVREEEVNVYIEKLPWDDEQLFRVLIKSIIHNDSILSNYIPFLVKQYNHKIFDGLIDSNFKNIFAKIDLDKKAKLFCSLIHCDFSPQWFKVEIYNFLTIKNNWINKISIYEILMDNPIVVPQISDLLNALPKITDVSVVKRSLKFIRLPNLKIDKYLRLDLLINWLFNSDEIIKQEAENNLYLFYPQAKNLIIACLQTLDIFYPSSPTGKIKLMARLLTSYLSQITVTSQPILYLLNNYLEHNDALYLNILVYLCYSQKQYCITLDPANRKIRIDGDVTRIEATIPHNRFDDMQKIFLDAIKLVQNKLFEKEIGEKLFESLSLEQESLQEIEKLPQEYQSQAYSEIVTNEMSTKQDRHIVEDITSSQTEKNTEEGPKKHISKKAQKILKAEQEENKTTFRESQNFLPKISSILNARDASIKHMAVTIDNSINVCGEKNPISLNDGLSKTKGEKSMEEKIIWERQGVSAPLELAKLEDYKEAIKEKIKEGPGANPEYKLLLEKLIDPLYKEEKKFLRKELRKFRRGMQNPTMQNYLKWLGKNYAKIKDINSVMQFEEKAIDLYIRDQVVSKTEKIPLVEATQKNESVSQDKVIGFEKEKMDIINQRYWYQDNDISDYVDVVIRHSLGGYLKGSHFLLAGIGDGRFPEEDGNRYWVAVTPAIDTVGHAAPLDSWLDKGKQPKPVEQDDRRDVWDEILPVISKQASAHVKILFGYNDTLIHWLLGEIQLHKTKNHYTVILMTHDPYGRGELDEKNFALLSAAIQQGIIQKDPLAQFEFKRQPSPYGRRQSKGDLNSCGVIVSADMVKRISGTSLDLKEPYPLGTEALRRKHLQAFKEHFPENDATRKNFIKRITQQSVSENLTLFPVATSRSEKTLLDVTKMVSLITGIQYAEIKQRIIEAITHRVYHEDKNAYRVGVETALLQWPVELLSHGEQIAYQDKIYLNELYYHLFLSKEGFQGQAALIHQIASQLTVVMPSELETETENIEDANEFFNAMRQLHFEQTLTELQSLTQSITAKPFMYLLSYDQEPKDVKKLFKRLKQDIKRLWGKKRLISPSFGKSGDSILRAVSKMKDCKLIIVLCTAALKQAYDQFDKDHVAHQELGMVFTQLIKQKAKVVPFYLQDKENVLFFLEDLTPGSLSTEEGYQKGIFTILQKLVEEPLIEEAIRQAKKKLKKDYETIQQFPEQLQQKLFNTLKQKQTAEQAAKMQAAYQQAEQVLAVQVSQQYPQQEGYKTATLLSEFSSVYTTPLNPQLPPNTKRQKTETEVEKKASKPQAESQEKSTDVNP